MNNCFFERFKSKDDVLREFNITDKELEDCSILFAWYGGGDWEGNALVLFERHGQLFEVRAGHCSCYGLEDSWTPVRVSWEFLNEKKEGYFEMDNKEAHVFLKKLIEENSLIEEDLKQNQVEKENSNANKVNLKNNFADKVNHNFESAQSDFASIIKTLLETAEIYKRTIDSLNKTNEISGQTIDKQSKIIDELMAMIKAQKE
jgi:hypothetical protein